MGDACVYVSQQLLDALERDKRGLKWQLARANKAAEARAAQLAACEAKVKDLMTIVEMNKNVADKAVQRSYGKECVLQRLHHERVQLQTRVETLYRNGLDLLQRRATVNRQREAFQQWRREATTRRRRRAAARRIVLKDRRRQLQRGFHRWRQSTAEKNPPFGQPSIAVYPLPPCDIFTYPVPEKPPMVPRPTVRFALSCSSSSVSSDSISITSLTDSHATLSFATWKAQWLARKRRRATATHFARLMLARRVLAAWKQAVRRRNWREAMIATATQRRRFHRFDQWVEWTKQRRRARTLMVKLHRRLELRTLRQAFVRLRVKCLEKCMAEWGEVLKDARNAIEEERKIYTLRQSQAMSELAKQAARQRLRQQQLMGTQLDVLDARRRQALLVRCLARWQRALVFRTIQKRVATQFHRFRKLRRLESRTFAAWKAKFLQAKQVNAFSQRRKRRQARILLDDVFRSLWRIMQRLRRRRKALRRIFLLGTKDVTLRCFWKWRASVSIENEKTNSHLQQRELSQRLDVRESTWRSEAQRLHRVAYKYQLQCALAMGDTKRERRTRVVFVAWKTRFQNSQKRRTALKRVLRHKASRFLAIAIATWSQKNRDVEYLQATLQARSTQRQRRRLRDVFHGWHSMIQRQHVTAACGRLQYLTLLLWKSRSKQQRSRNVALGRILRFHLLSRWQKPAFDSWRKKSNVARLIETRRLEQRTELLQRTFRRWTTRLMRCARRARRQCEAIASQAERRALRRQVENVWSAWRAIVSQRRVKNTGSTMCFALRSKSQHRRALRLSFSAWVSCFFRPKHLRILLQRIVCRRFTQAKASAWVRWRGIIASHQSMQAGQRQASIIMQRRLTAHRLKRVLRTAFSFWRQRVQRSSKQQLLLSQWLRRRRLTALAICMVTWRQDFVSRARFRRVLLRSGLEAKKKAVIRLALQRWRGHATVLSAIHTQLIVSDRHSKAQSRALEILRRAWASRDLRSCFLAWQKYTRRCRDLKSTVERLVKKKAMDLKLLVLTTLSNYCEKYRSIQRLAEIRNRSRTRVAWVQLHGVAKAIGTRDLVVNRLHTILYRVFLRAAWTLWKRQDRVALKDQVALTHLSVSLTLHSFMDRLGLRHFTKSLLLRTFGRWRTHARSQRQLRQRILELLTRQDSLNAKKCFQGWSRHVRSDRELRTILLQTVNRRIVNLESQSFAKWKAFAIERGYEIKLVATQRQLQKQREALARHVALAMFSSWQKPTLVAVLRAWRSLVSKTKGVFEAMAAKTTARLLRKVIYNWRDRILQMRAASLTLGKLLFRKRRDCVGRAWQSWTKWCWRLAAVEFSLHRLSTFARGRLLRSAWVSLRAHCDHAQRHQSMVAVVSAQQQLRQQKELFRLRRVAFVMHRHERSCVKEPFVAWKLFVVARRQHHALAAAVDRRYSRRAARKILRHWRHVVIQSRVQRNRINKWLTTKSKPRRTREVWSAWVDFVVRRGQARMLLQQLAENQSLHARYVAWRTWHDSVTTEIQAERANEACQWRRATAMQQQQMESLEVKHERLLLESVKLRQAAQSQRLRSAMSFVTRLMRVENAVVERRVRQSWNHWALLSEKSHLMQRALNRLRMSRECTAFARWKEAANQAKWSQHQTVMLDRVAHILGEASTQTRKKTAWRQWRMFVKQRVSKRKHRTVIEMLRRRTGGGTTLRCVFASWKILIRERRRRVSTAFKMKKLVDERYLRLVVRAWSTWREGERSKREGWLVVARIQKAIERRALQRSWLRWRSFASDVAVVHANTRAVLLEVETAERELKYANDTTLLRAFTAWRETSTHLTRCRDELGRLLAEFRAKWASKEALSEWRRRSLLKKLGGVKRQRPVLCIRTHIKRRRTKLNGSADEGAVINYGQYVQHRHVRHWRVQLASHVARTRLRRTCGLAWMLSCLRRHHRRVLRRSLWTWLAKIQPMSHALQAVDYRELPWRRADVDYAGSMLLLALEELDLARQTHRNELMQRAWRVVDAIVRSANRHGVRRAFDKWRWTQRARRTSSYGGTCRAMANTERTRARACAAQLVRVRLRRAFAQWKTQYVASAMEQARAEYEALQATLEAATTRRRYLMGAARL